MNKILKHRKLIIVISSIFLLLALFGFIMCYIYTHRHWNTEYFINFHAPWTFFFAYLIESSALLILSKILTLLSIFIITLGAIAVIITVSVNCIGLNKVIEGYKLDCQLESDDSELFNEAIDSLLISAYSAPSYYDEPEPLLLKAARNNYPAAQNAVGCFYHEKAKNSKADKDFDRSIFWFLKAAQNNDEVAQTNLGRIYMGALVSNQYIDIEQAKLWLQKACNNNYSDAFFYMGKIYYKESLRNAYLYWSKGAELGNEKCMQALEKPEFINGIPVDKEIVYSLEADSCQTTDE